MVDRVVGEVHRKQGYERTADLRAIKSSLHRGEKSCLYKLENKNRKQLGGIAYGCNCLIIGIKGAKPMSSNTFRCF